MLASHFRVISYQLRGEDDPFALRQRFGLPELVDDLAELIEWLGLESPAVMGVSFTPPIQLSFGFSLDRVGGIIGAGRTVDTDALAQGGLMVYGAECGRYPVCPTVVIEW